MEKARTTSDGALQLYKPKLISAFSTVALHSSERLAQVKAYFHANGACAEFRSAGRGEFHSAVEVTRFGSIPITSITGSSTVIKTTANDPRKTGDIALHYIHRGAQLITKRHTTHTICEGDAYLLADIGALTTETQGPAEMISLRLPAAVLRDWVIVPEEMTARPLSRHSEFGRARTAVSVYP